MPRKVITHVMVGNFQEAMRIAPPGDINIFGISGKRAIAPMHIITEAMATPCLFTRNSGLESSWA